MSVPSKILVVCTGNTCRSAMALQLARKRFSENGHTTIFDSAGVRVENAGSPSPPQAIETIKAYGLDLTSHGSKPVTPELVAWADVIWAMTQSHLDILVAEFPGSKDKADRLSSAEDIADPWEQPLAVYQATCKQLEAALDGRLASFKSCCPPGRTPALTKPDEYKQQGKFIDIDGVNTYSVGSSTGGKAVILVADIMAFSSGRHANICDQLAAELGVWVVGPDLFMGETPGADGFMPLIKKSPKEVWQPYLDKVYAHLKTQGIESSGLIGFCFGSWVVFHESARNAPVSCGVNCHPSLVIENKFFGGSDGGLEKLAERAAHPMLMFPCLGSDGAGADPPAVCAGGSVDKILAAKPFGASCKFIDCEGMKHGFVSQGDVTDENVAKSITMVMKETVAFFKANM